MTTGVTAPSLAIFREQARDRRVIPVHRRLLADGETPVGVYRKLAAGRPGTFLLESAASGRWSRYSFVGVRSAATLTEAGGEAVWTGTPPAGVPVGGDPLVALHATMAALRTPRTDELPPLTGGLVGYLSYDVARRLERLPNVAAPGLPLPELAMLLVSDLAVLDHSDGSLVLIANAINLDGSDERVDEAWADAVARLEAMVDALAAPAPATTAITGDIGAPQFASRTPAGDYQPAVRQALAAIRAGEVFQVQIGQRFETPVAADALELYRALRSINPSPYLYLLRLDGFDIVGASPEALVTVTDRRAVLHPIAGTRPRGADPQQDAALAAELLANAKERAEHVMLVDLGRNDLGRVCSPGSVEVVEFGALERYSHVWHIVSTVVGEVAANKDALDVLMACFPAGTLTGAPKVRAMELIDELEPVRRGVYGGAVGYLDVGGDLDMAIAIRTAVLRDGIAYVQASAGIVADSDPAAEEAETRAKASAVLRAAAVADTLRPAAAAPGPLPV
ncbi:MAG TPA: anthranilate synthase component I [Mycobacteriales bacterium]|jgi:anthranilate synthase component 1|nr:anthranilate synthase component I [Mycobacteriales bacterium]